MAMAPMRDPDGQGKKMSDDSGLASGLVLRGVASAKRVPSFFSGT